jgi:Ca2+-transporting ATPase
MRTLVLCNDSKLQTKENGVEILGDPTETALVRFAYDKGYYNNSDKLLLERVGEIPFDSGRKLMTTVNADNHKNLVMTKGAPDVLLNKCIGIYVDNEIKPMTEEDRERIISANRQMAGKALRVLGAAFKQQDVMPAVLKPEEVENDLVFIGLVGMIDPPRPEVRDAVELCRTAGIRPIMITGDHRDTAAAIAKQLDIASSDDEIITGRELDQIPEESFEQLVTKYSVYARVSPEHKVRIVKAWKKQDKVVAMTGDGVNDAPALKASDIGVGMGITGTDVAKGVSNMVLADDNFATIVSAVGEGRKIYANIRKSIHFLLSCNLGEVLTLFIGTMLNWVVLLPIHILWINLVTDTIPALALGVENAEKDVMKQKPRNAKDSFFSHGVGVSMIYQGIIEALIVLGTYYLGRTTYSLGVGETMAFATLGLIQLAHSMNVRSVDKSLFKIGVFTNKYLNIAIVVSALMQIMVIIIPYFNHMFKVSHLNIVQWLIVVAASLLIIPVVEIGKLIMFRKEVKAN